MATASSIREVSRPLDHGGIHEQVRSHIDDQFADLEILTGHAGPSTPSTSSATFRKGRKRRTLHEDIDYWEAKAKAADQELHETSATLPGLLQSTQERLGQVLRSAQELSLQRYSLADKLSTLISELDSSAVQPRQPDDTPLEPKSTEKTVLERMEELQAEISSLEAGLIWVTILEQVLTLSEKTLDVKGHHPSPLAALPRYIALHEIVDGVMRHLPESMALVSTIKQLRDQTWRGLKDIMSKNLLDALEGLRWPVKVDYPNVPTVQRRAFERAYQDLLYLQAEGEALGVDNGPAQWYDGRGFYPLQAMIQPIALRFKYHFQGSRNTNRVDKPEWAFTSVLDRIYEHQSFIEEYLEPLTQKAGFTQVDVKSEFIMLLFPILLGLLRSRIPHLLDTPALLAHTIYQTVVFDDAIRESGFDLDNVSINEGVENGPWEGLAGVILREEGWFDRWLAGEKKFAESQLQEIISAPDAWNISDEAPDEGEDSGGLKPTTSARQIKALIEQVTDRYSPLPSSTHRLPFLASIQLPILASYLSRVSGSLDAFETLSSAFVRAVPGALAGNTRSGVHIDQTKLTSGKAGLERLIKANLSAAYVLQALRIWSDDIFFVELSSELRNSTGLQQSVQAESLLPGSLRSGGRGSSSVFDIMTERYEALAVRTEEMMVKHVSAEVETDLKQHLTRRWDRTEGESVPDSSLLHALTTYSSHLSTLSLLPPLSTLRVYRKIANHLTNHISQRAVYAGWSKFTSLGGKDFSDEIKDWVNTSLQVEAPGGEAAVKMPWRGLEDVAKMLRLRTDDEVDGGEEGSGQSDEPTFGQAMAVAWSDGEETYKVWKERTGIRMDRQTLRDVLKRRKDCWR